MTSETFIEISLRKYVYHFMPAFIPQFQYKFIRFSLQREKKKPQYGGHAIPVSL
jgi:hypothetical protein